MKPGSIHVFRMINGEEIISEIKNIFDETFELKNPAQIMLQPTQSGSMGVGIAPYMPYADGAVSLHKSAIAADAEPADALKSEYNRIFGVGIVTAPASILTSLK